MDRRGEIARVLRGARGERLPRALFGAGRWACRQTGLRVEHLRENPELFAETLAGFFGALDTDIVFAGSGLNCFPAEAIGGDLALNGWQAPLLAAPVIREMRDAQRLEKVDIAESPHALALLEMIAGLRRRLPDRFLCATAWGPFTWAMILCDGDLLKEKTKTDRAFVGAVCDLGVRLSAALLRPLVQQGLIDGICVADGATTLIPDDLYREVVLPREKLLFAQAGSHGVARFLHQCGDTRSQLKLYPDTGADCISLDATVDLHEAYALYHRRVVTAGNVDVVKHVCDGDPAQLSAAVTASLAGIPDPFSKFILLPSCDLPPETPRRNAEAFLACADRVG